MKIVVGVTGGIAAYKSAQLVRELVKRGDEVRVVMTRSAEQFITPMTLQIVSGHAVGTTLFDPGYESEIGHIELARWADVVLIAPATANTIAKLAHGFADDLLTTVTLATTSPVVVAPAMNTQMWRDERVQRNTDMLRALSGYHVVSPDRGQLACREEGAGRLPDPPALLAAVDFALSPKPLAGKRALVSAGPTRERIDAARYLSNPSTGKMGYAMARAAWLLGAQVTLVSGPTHLEAIEAIERVDVLRAEEMFEAIMARAEDADLIIKCAAVADWRPASPSDSKRPKSEMNGLLKLERTRDILAELCERYGEGSGLKNRPTIVGFAAESHDVEARAKAKLERKGADWLVSNRIGGDASAFGSDTLSATLLRRHELRPPQRFGPLPKPDLAVALLEAIARG